MILKFADLAICLSKAREISAKYASAVNGQVTFPKSIDVLVDVCKAYLPREIVIKDMWPEAGSANDSIRSFCLNMHGQPFEICLLSGLNYCWRRYCVCFELFHAILEQPAANTTSIYSHIQDVLDAFPDASAMGTPATRNEALAEFGVMEFLFPYSEREKLALPLTEPRSIAEQYKVPQVLVERYTGEQYMDALKGLVNV